MPPLSTPDPGTGASVSITSRGGLRSECRSGIAAGEEKRDGTLATGYYGSFSCPSLRVKVGRKVRRQEIGGWVHLHECIFRVERDLSSCY